MKRPFQAALALGLAAENRIAIYLRARGHWLLPAYEIEATQKGPRLLMPRGEVVAPDFLVLNPAAAAWVEAKWKTRFSWHRKSRSWQTGINYSYYKDYLQIASSLRQFPVWLFFLHELEDPSPDDQKHGCPPLCPVGLFGGNLLDLSQRFHHIDRPHNMIYWCAPESGHDKDVIRIATLAQIEATIRTPNGAGHIFPALPEANLSGM